MLLVGFMAWERAAHGEPVFGVAIGLPLPGGILLDDVEDTKGP